MQPDEQTRRDWIGSCAVVTAGMAGLAGCMGGSDDENGSDDSSTDDETEAPGSETGEFGAWPMVRYNAANRLVTSHDGVDGEPELAWTVELEGATVKPPVVYDDVAFVGHGEGMYTAVGLHDGDKLWDHETPIRHTNNGPGEPAVSEDALYVPGDGVEALDREAGDVLWSTGHEAVQTIRIYDGEIYVGLDDRIAVLDPAGDERIAFETPSTVCGIAVDEGRIYVRSLIDEDEWVYSMSGYDREDGSEVWSHELPQSTLRGAHHTRTSPVYEGSVYTIESESVVRIDGEDGTLEEIVEFDQISSRPTVRDGEVVAQGGMERYSIETGETPDGWDSDANPISQAVFAGGAYYAISFNPPLGNPRVYKIDGDTGQVESYAESQDGEANHTVPVVLDGLVLVSTGEFGLAAYK